MQVRTNDWNMRDMVDIEYAANNGLVKMDLEVTEGVTLTSEMPRAVNRNPKTHNPKPRINSKLYTLRNKKSNPTPGTLHPTP